MVWQYSLDLSPFDLLYLLQLEFQEKNIYDLYLFPLFRWNDGLNSFVQVLEIEYYVIRKRKFNYLVLF